MVEKTELSLENGEKIEVSGSQEDIQNATFFVPNWKAGNSPHKSMSQAFLKAMAKVDESVLVGEFEGKPVFNAEKAWDNVIGSTIEKMGLDIEKTVATARVGIKKQLNALQQAVIDANPELAKQLNLM